MNNRKELIERLRTESLYKDKATLEIMDLCMEAADALAVLQAKYETLARYAAEKYTQCDAMEKENARLRAELEQVKRERDELRDDFIDFGCCGIPNLAPFCKNKSGECTNIYGWCETQSTSCKGFLPSAWHGPQKEE